jgi:MFS family permease
MTGVEQRAGETNEKAERRTVLLVLFASVFSFAISFSGILPWMALQLEARSVDSILIGLVSAANPIGVMVMVPFAARIARRMGVADAMIAGSLVSTVPVALLPWFDSVTGWIVLRFISGLGGALPWILSETWINMAAKGGARSRVLAIYVTLIAAGFAVGPLVVTAIGIHGNGPVMAFVVLSLVAIVPIFIIRNLSVPLEAQQRGRALWHILIAMPTIFAATFLAGTVDTAFFSFLPIWGMRVGYEAAPALQLLSVFVAGNIVLQFPIGWLADRAGTKVIMALCGMVCVAAPVLVFGCVAYPLLLGMTLFVWGGAAWALYSLALAEIGHRFTGTPLVTASGAAVFAYTVSNVVGPPLVGTAMEVWDPHGLLIVAGVLAVVFLSILALRSAGRSPH